MLHKLSFSFFVWLLFPTLVLANHLPSPSNYVNDFAGVLAASEVENLNSQLSNFQQQTGVEIAIAIVKSLNGEDIADYTVKAFEEWKVGQKGKDNGVLLLVSVEDRKLRIEVGYGLEGSLNDAAAGDIIRQVISPKFKNQDYYGGLGAGITAIEQRLASGGQVSDKEKVAAHEQIIGRIIKALFSSGFGVYLLIIGFIYLGSFLGRSKSWWAGGVIGAGVGAALGWVLVSVLIGSLAAIILGLFGLFLDWLLSKNYQQRKDKGFPNTWWGSGGGFSSSGGSGFGGFGGGSSGGGGASGDW